jgi:N-acetylmuramoyl-L-alanine amidase
MQSKSQHQYLILVVISLLLLTLAACGESGSTPTPESAGQIPVNFSQPTLAFNALPTTLAAPIPTSTPVPSPTPQIPPHVVIIDPGHGADDWGTFHSDANGQPDILEKDIVLKIGQKIASQLDPAHFKVVLTRTTDNSPNNPPQDFNGDGKIDQVDDLQARINIANENKGELFLSLHINSSELGNEVDGLETWYCADRPFAAQSQKFAELIQAKSLESLSAAGYTAQNRRVGDDIALEGDEQHIFVLGPDTGDHTAATNMPGALAETLFISNDREAALLNDDKVQDKLAGGFAAAIKEYFANP